MQYGFSYNGVHCNDMHCTYVPTAKKRWVLPSYDTISSDVTERDGGYYYRTRQNIRTFSLDCFFENITEHQLRKIARWLDRKTAGELIFDARPDVVYRVRPSKQLEPEIYEHLLEGNKDRTYSGTFTATFTAYEPFGFMKKKAYNVGDDADHYMTYCGMLRTDEMPPEATASSRKILLYNCGTEPCGLYFSLRGKAPNGFTITNETNGSVCKVLGMPTSPLLLVVDGENCKVLCGNGTYLGEKFVIVADGYVLMDIDDNVIYEHVGPEGIDLNAETAKRAFEFHDEGYIILEPYGEVYRDVSAKWSAGSNTVYIESSEILSLEDIVGKFIRLNGSWLKIVDSLDDGGLVLSERIAIAGAENTMITTMNELIIEGEGVSIEDISITYTPRVL